MGLPQPYVHQNLSTKVVENLHNLTNLSAQKDMHHKSQGMTENHQEYIVTSHVMSPFLDIITLQSVMPTRVAKWG
jgi:hypothetical protein